MASPERSEVDDLQVAAAPDLGLDVATEVQALFLTRLRQLLEKRYSGARSVADEQQLVLDRAIYSTFCDCLTLGVSAQARALLHRHQNL